jgi:hypothetical protein
MRPMEETMIILHFENDPKRIIAFEEVEIMKAIISDHMLNIIQNIKSLYRMIQSVQSQTMTSGEDC